MNLKSFSDKHFVGTTIVKYQFIYFFIFTKEYKALLSSIEKDIVKQGEC